MTRLRGNITAYRLGYDDAIILALGRAHREGDMDLSRSMLMEWLNLPPFVQKDQ